MQGLSFGHFHNSGAELSLQGIRLLAVDNNRDCCDFLSMLFQFYGADARVVDSASQAFDLFWQFQPQILVFDLAMPAVNGFGLLESIRRLESQQNQPHTPAIAITARVTDTICQQVYQVGYQALFLKPIDIDTFVATIAHLAQTSLNPTI